MSSSPSNSNFYKTFTVDPSANLSYSTTYKIRLTTGVKDSAGNILSSQYEGSYETACSDNVGFAIGGRSGLIFTSPNGTNCWKNRTSGTTEHFDGGISYLNNLFIALGQSGTILTSSDGVTWTSRTSGSSRNLWAVAYGNSTYVVVGGSGTILTSSDGISWTSRSSGTSSPLYGVSFGNNVFVAVGYSATILSSSDGSSWSSRSGAEGQLDTVTYGNGKFIAVGAAYNKLFSSGDGTNWTTVSHGSTLGMKGIVYANNKFVAVGHSGEILTSSDGGTWSLSTTGGMSYMNVVFGNGIFVGMGYNGIRTSSDNGSTWNSLSSSTSISGTTLEGLSGGYKE
jgi:photosystem II stability/assembly factor-like uncharacterized protein